MMLFRDPLPVLGKVFRSFLILSALSVFAIYWFLTLLYVTPNNPIRIDFDTELLTFGSLFYQRWSFFAPPPRYNIGLYYTFTDKADPSLVRVFDVSSPILNSKKRTLPYNEGAELVDYMIFGSVDSLSQSIRSALRLNKYQGLPRTDEEIIREILSFETSVHPSVVLLKRYGEIVAAKNGIEFEDHYLTVTATKNPLPRFSKRNSPDRPEPELLFRSL